jgi:hypothetical protein
MRENSSVPPPYNRIRRFAAFVCLLVIAGFEISTLKFRELAPRLRSLPVMVRLDPDRARVYGSGFAFDRRYGEFLISVRDATPVWATIELEAPSSSQLYGYSAAYVLAPRRVVPPERLSEAGFAAKYEGGFGRLSSPGQRH